MSDKKIRRTLALAAGRQRDLEAIKAHEGLKTDTAAISASIEFRARLADWDLSEIRQALGFWDEIKRELRAGRSLFVEDEKEEEPRRSRTKLLIPAYMVGAANEHATESR